VRVSIGSLLAAAAVLVAACTPTSTAAQTSAPAHGTVRWVAEQARPAVVQITTQQAVSDLSGQSYAAPTGVGSGVIYDPTGLVLTNSHVVDQSTSLLVSLPDGRTFSGTLLGQDRLMDLAVVKLEPGSGQTLPVATLGDSSNLAVGDEVVAIGNALALPGGPTVTAGVVSALDRAVQEPGDSSGNPGPYLYDLIQTDAAINPGNSGGPLLDMHAEVIGINTLAAGGAAGIMAQGVGFAISINAARPIAAQLAASNTVFHPYLGIAYVAVNPGLAWQLNLTVQQGLVITAIAPGSPAASAGVLRRDVITEVDGQALRDETTLGRVLNKHAPGDQVRLTVDRGGARQTLSVTLGKRSE
jgi:S1-C subfamily serine protease